MATRVIPEPISNHEFNMKNWVKILTNNNLEKMAVKTGIDTSDWNED